MFRFSVLIFLYLGDMAVPRSTDPELNPVLSNYATTCIGHCNFMLAKIFSNVEDIIT